MQLKMHVARYGASCAFSCGVLVSSATTAPISAASSASPQPNGSGGEATGFADQIDQFNAEQAPSTSPQSIPGAVDSKVASPHPDWQPIGIGRSVLQSPGFSPLGPLASLNGQASFTASGDGVSPGSLAPAPPLTNTKAPVDGAIAKAPKGRSKDPQKQPRINQDAVPILTSVNTQAPPSPPPLDFGLPGQTGNESESSSHASAQSSQPAMAQAVSLTNPLIVDQNPGAKTTVSGKGSLTNDQPPASEDLTFAARIQPAAAQSKSSGDSTRKAGTDPTPLVRHSVADSNKEQPSETPAPIGHQPSAAALMQRFEGEAPRAELGKPAPASPAQPLAEPQAAKSEEPISKTPLKDISFQVGQAQGQRVEVRVTQQAGELRVAVRTGDGEVAQGLRQGLSDLTTKLNENGYRAETWHPGDSGTLTPGSAKEAADTPGQSPNGGSQSHSQSHSQSQSGSPQQSYGQQNQNPSNRPRWVQELETTLRSGAGSTGDFNGLIS